MALNKYEQLRRSGKSTARALSYVSEAIKKPGEWIDVSDHFPGRQADLHLFSMISDIVQQLGLIDFEFNSSRMQMRSNYYGLVLNTKTGEIREAKKKDY